MSWYVVQTQVGREQKAVEAIQEDILELRNPALKKVFGQILVPMENKVEMQQGQKPKQKKEVTYKGYILLEVIDEERLKLEQESGGEDVWKELWHTVRQSRWVRGFVGGRKGDSWQPAPISKKDYEAVIQRMEQGESSPQPSKMYEIGEIVRVIDGPLKDYEGEVEEVNYDRSRMRVMVSIFGRSVPVDVVFDQVEKT